MRHGESFNAARRDFLGQVGLATLASGLPVQLLQAATGEKQIAGFHPEWVPPVATLKTWLKQLHDFGTDQDLFGA